MWKYNYLRERIDDATLEDRCNALGEQHWDLRFLRWLDGECVWDAFFKRTHTDRDRALAAMYSDDRAGMTFEEQRAHDARREVGRAELAETLARWNSQEATQ